MTLRERHFEYTKNNFGFDAYWRFLPNNRLGVGWDYWDIKQNRHDYDKMRTNRLFVEWKNTSLPNLSGRLKYTYFQRRSDFLLGDAGVDANDPAFLERFTSRFDLSSLDRNEIKLIGDWSPMPLLDFSLEATWKDNKYKDITLGRTSDRREDIYLSASWGDPVEGSHHRLRRLRAHHATIRTTARSASARAIARPARTASIRALRPRRRHSTGPRETGTTTGSSASAPTGRRPSA